MKTPNRDLLVLLRDESMSEQAIEHEVELLNKMLFHVESAESVSRAHEVIDMNKFRIYQQQKHVLPVTRQKKLKPFQFLFNRN